MAPTAGGVETASADVDLGTPLETMRVLVDEYGDRIGISDAVIAAVVVIVWLTCAIPREYSLTDDSVEQSAHEFNDWEMVELPEGYPPATAEQPDVPSAEVTHEFDGDGV